MITVEFGDGTQRELCIHRDDVSTLLQMALCAIKMEHDQEHNDIARKITRAWLP